MYLKQSLNNITNFYLSLTDLFLFSKTGLLMKYNKRKIWERDVDTQHLLFEYKQYIFPYTNYKKIDKISISDGKLQKSLDINIFPIERLNNYLWVESKIDEDFYISKLSLDNLEITNYSKLGKNRIIKILLNKSFLSKNNALITCHSINIGEILWQLNWKEVINNQTAYLISNDLLVVNNLLFLSFANKDQAPIGSIVIDINTGKLIQELPTLNGFLYNNNIKEIIATSGIFNDKQTLCNYNIATNTCKEIILNDIFPYPNWSIKHESSVIHNNKLYLAIQQGATFIASVLAIFDLEKNTIIDTYELLKDHKKGSTADNWFHIEKIKVNDSMLAVLTAGGTLHIFEEEPITNV